MQEAVLNRQRGRGPGDLLRTAWSVSWPTEARHLWLRDTFLAGGWSFVGKSIPARSFYAGAIALGLLGWAWRLSAVALARRGLRHGAARPGRGKSRLDLAGAGTSGPIFDSAWTPLACLLLCASITASLDYHAVQSRLAWGRSTTGPWYASAGLPWFLALGIAGAMCWPSRRLGAAIAAVLVGSCVAGEQTLLSARMLPAYSGGAGGLQALRRVAQLQPAWFGAGTALAATAAAGLLLIAAAATIARIRIPAVVADPASSPSPSLSPSPRGPHRTARPVAHPGNSAANVID